MRRHEADWASLLGGLLFIGIGLAYLLGALTHVHIAARWILPILFVGLGVAGLAGTTLRALRRRDGS